MRNSSNEFKKVNTKYETNLMKQIHSAASQYQSVRFAPVIAIVRKVKGEKNNTT